MSTKVSKQTKSSNEIYTVLQVVFGVKMTSIQEMEFAKYKQTLDFGMNVKTKKERTKIAHNWLNSINQKNKN